VHAFGISLMPQATLVLVFVTMALVLALRPQGLLGKALDAGPREVAHSFDRVPGTRRGFALVCAADWLAGVSGVVGRGLLAIPGQRCPDPGDFWCQFAGHDGVGRTGELWARRVFALGAYGAALSHTVWGWSLPGALFVGCVCALSLAGALGGVLVRSAGVYLAMLSLALAQVVWATASQWVVVTGGDNGVIGLQLVSSDTRTPFFALLLALALLSVAALARLSRSTLGAALQAVRDAPQRAAASGLSVSRIKYRIYVESATLAGLAGGLFAAHQGAVFPSVAAVSTSVDALLVILLGGVHQLWGAFAGASILVWAAAELGRGFDYWRGAVGLLVMVIMVVAPSGLLGLRWARPGLPTGQGKRT
jgi:branched-chain amino acid transport system permease protein